MNKLQLLKLGLAVVLLVPFFVTAESYEEVTIEYVAFLPVVGLKK